MLTAENLVNTTSNDHKTPLYHSILAGRLEILMKIYENIFFNSDGF